MCRTNCLPAFGRSRHGRRRRYGRQKLLHDRRPVLLPRRNVGSGHRMSAHNVGDRKSPLQSRLLQNLTQLMLFLRCQECSLSLEGKSAGFGVRLYRLHACTKTFNWIPFHCAMCTQTLPSARTICHLFRKTMRPCSTLVRTLRNYNCLDVLYQRRCDARAPKPRYGEGFG